MTTLLCLLSVLQADPNAVPARKKESAEIRLYVIDKANPPLDLSLAAAALVLQSEGGRGRTLAMELVTPDEGAAETSRGQIRRLEGSAAFAEILVDKTPRPSAKGLRRAPKNEESVEDLIRKSVPPEPKKEGEAPAPAPEKPKAPSIEERLAKAHSGPYFRVLLPASELPERFEATVTLRVDSRTFSARGFRTPLSAKEDVDAILGRIDESLKTILRLCETADFGKVPVEAGRIREELNRLSGLSLENNGDFDYAWTYCLGLADQIDRASRSGAESVSVVVGKFNAKLSQLKSALKK
jgi:hypothetical protein